MHERFALGCGPFGGLGSNPRFFGQGLSEAQAFALMDAAWELGIRWFDTADAYGGGRSETMVGNWIRATGNRPRLTTKTFNPVEEGGDRGLARDRILRRAESSLERLGIDTIDVYLAHDFDPETALAETVGAFEQLVEQGAIDSWGVSNFAADKVSLAQELGRPSLVQNSYSLLERADETDVIPLCRELGIRYQAFSPLAGGWLTGKYRRGEPPPAGSRMAIHPTPYLHLDDERVYAQIDALEVEADAEGLSLPALALSRALAVADSVVVGPQRPEHLDPVREVLS